MVSVNLSGGALSYMKTTLLGITKLGINYIILYKLEKKTVTKQGAHDFSPFLFFLLGSLIFILSEKAEINSLLF